MLTLSWLERRAEPRYRRVRVVVGLAHSAQHSSGVEGRGAPRDAFVIGSWRGGGVMDPPGRAKCRLVSRWWQSLQSKKRPAHSHLSLLWLGKGHPLHLRWGRRSHRRTQELKSGCGQLVWVQASCCLRVNRCPWETGTPGLPTGGLHKSDKSHLPATPCSPHFLPLNTRCHFALDWVKVGL